MTKENKELLLQDLCERLPYGVTIHTNNGDITLDRNHRGIGVLYYEHYSEEAKKRCGYDKNHYSIIISGCYYGEDIKPYLRPMSSMTEEERNEVTQFEIINLGPIGFNWKLLVSNSSKLVDWLNSHHFDYRGLIEKGLALEAPEGMYEI